VRFEEPTVLVVEGSGILGCNTLHWGSQFATFQKNLHSLEIWGTVSWLYFQRFRCPTRNFL